MVWASILLCHDMVLYFCIYLSVWIEKNWIQLAFTYLFFLFAVVNIWSTDFIHLTGSIAVVYSNRLMWKEYRKIAQWSKCTFNYTMYDIFCIFFRSCYPILFNFRKKLDSRATWVRTFNTCLFSFLLIGSKLLSWIKLHVISDKNLWLASKTNNSSNTNANKNKFNTPPPPPSPLPPTAPYSPLNSIMLYLLLCYCIFILNLYSCQTTSIVCNQHKNISKK